MSILYLSPPTLKFESEAAKPGPARYPSVCLRGEDNYNDEDKKVVGVELKSEGVRMVFFAEQALACCLGEGVGGDFAFRVAPQEFPRVLVLQGYHSIPRLVTVVLPQHFPNGFLGMSQERGRVDDHGELSPWDAVLETEIKLLNSGADNDARNPHGGRLDTK